MHFLHSSCSGIPKMQRRIGKAAGVMMRFPAHWIGDDVIYHEGCAVLMPDGRVQLWDASAAWWVNPAQTAGYGSLAAVKIWTGADSQHLSLQWGTRSLVANEWTVL